MGLELATISAGCKPCFVSLFFSELHYVKNRALSWAPVKPELHIKCTWCLRPCYRSHMASLAAFVTHGVSYLHHQSPFRTQILSLVLCLTAPRDIHHDDWILSSLQARVFCYLASPPVFSNRMGSSWPIPSWQKKRMTKKKKITGCKWEKEKTSVKLIKGKHGLDPLFLLLFVCFLCSHRGEAFFPP